MAVMYRNPNEFRSYSHGYDEDAALGAAESWRSYSIGQREVDKLGDDWSLDAEVAGFSY